MNTVYLLHFDSVYVRVRHYLGYTTDLSQRLESHAKGQGARLMEVVTDAGIGFTLARTWQGGRDMERRLKRQKNASRFCPLCRSRGYADG